MLKSFLPEIEILVDGWQKNPSLKSWNFNDFNVCKFCTFWTWKTSNFCIWNRLIKISPISQGLIDFMFRSCCSGWTRIVECFLRFCFHYNSVVNLVIRIAFKYRIEIIAKYACSFRFCITISIPVKHTYCTISYIDL